MPDRYLTEIVIILYFKTRTDLEYALTWCFSQPDSVHIEYCEHRNSRAIPEEDFQASAASDMVHNITGRGGVSTRHPSHLRV